MSLSPVNACFTIIVMALNGDYGRVRRWAQIAVVAASVGGLAVSIVDRAWLFGVAYLIAGVIAIWRALQTP